MADRSSIHHASMLVDYLQRRFDRAEPGSEPDHHCLCRALQEGILCDKLQSDAHLPSSRQLATELGIARNTVIHVYEQFDMESYVSADVGSNIPVVDTAPGRLNAALAPATATAAVTAVATAPIVEVTAPSAPILSTHGRALVHDAGVSSRQWGASMPGVPEVRTSPARIWSRLRSRLLRKPSPALLTYPVDAGYLPLHTVLADYLRTAHGVRYEPERIIIIAGIHPSLQLIAQLPYDAGNSAWIEDPGYWDVRNVLTAASMHMMPLSVDNEGMRFDLSMRGRQCSRPPKLMVVSSSYQYPLSSVMNLVRHHVLLATTQATDVWIVEDDYDGEPHYDSRPLPSSQGLDEGGRVLYVGTFLRILFLSSRTGYLIVPLALADTFTTGLPEVSHDSQILTQAMLADSIAEGYSVPRTQCMRGMYTERHEALLAPIVHEFDDALPVHDGASGLRLVLSLPTSTNDVAVADLAFASDAVTHPLSRCYQGDTRHLSELLFGYGHVGTEQIATRFHMLTEAVHTVG